MSEFLSRSETPVPSGDRADRIEMLVRRRGEIEQRRLETTRAGRASIAFAAAWAFVPLFETMVTGLFSPRAFVFHLGLVVPWALLIGVFADRRAPVATIDVGASGVALAAVLATLAGHRLDPTGRLVAFDAVAVLPLLHVLLFVRPRPSVAGGVTALGGAAIVLANLSSTAPGTFLGWFSAVAVALGLVLFAARRFEKDLHAARLARLRAEIAAHRLTHHADELRQLSEVDMLTGVANRRSIDRRLPEIAEHAVLEDLSVGVMMIDVDHFKRFNDLWGHQAGDRCLVEVAKAAGAQIRRAGDLFGRFGGEEFVAVLPGAGIEGTLRVAERIRAAVAGRLVATTAGNKRVTVSIGCASGKILPGWTIEDLLRTADRQLYAAKDAGRNRVTPSLPERDPSTDGVGRRVA